MESNKDKLFNKIKTYGKATANAVGSALPLVRDVTEAASNPISLLGRKTPDIYNWLNRVEEDPSNPGISTSDIVTGVKSGGLAPINTQARDLVDKVQSDNILTPAYGNSQQRDGVTADSLNSAMGYNTSYAAGDVNPNDVSASNVETTPKSSVLMMQEWLNDRASDKGRYAIDPNRQFSPEQLDMQKNAVDKSYTSAIANQKDAEDSSSSSALSKLNNVSGLNNETMNKIYTISKDFRADKQVQKFIGLQEAVNAVNAISSDTKNPANHQALIYGFAKALDPESVVREGEYETIKKYSQGMADRYEGEIKQALSGTGFLSPKAISDIQVALQTRYAPAEKSYNQIRSQYEKQLNLFTDDSEIIKTSLFDYGSNYQPSTGQSKATSSTGGFAEEW
jgi:hypothetical protein